MQPPIRTNGPDDFMTPALALEPLYPFLKKEWVLWECAAGSGNLVRAFEQKGYSVIGSDILVGHDFLTSEPEHFDCIVTNPPYSLKQKFLERCYQLKKPFALLLPLTTFETAKRQKLFREYGLEVIFFDKRINFEVPDSASLKKTGSWFATCWITNWLNIGKAFTFAELGKEG